MKKLFTILALVLTVALCASFAVSATTYNNLASIPAQDVSLTYDPVNEATVYSVDVAWTDLTFTYSAGTEKWDPTKHTYSISNDDADWTNTDGSITVTNHSNADVDVTVEYAKATGYDVEVDVTNGEFTLESAVDKAVSAADFETVTFSVDTAASTAPTVDDATVGTVTVTIAAVVAG